MDRAYKLENIYESLLSKLQDLPNFTNKTEQLLYDLFENEEPSNFIKVRVLDVINSIKGCGDWIPEWFIEESGKFISYERLWEKYKNFNWIRLEIRSDVFTCLVPIYIDLKYISEKCKLDFSEVHKYINKVGLIDVYEALINKFDLKSNLSSKELSDLKKFILNENSRRYIKYRVLEVANMVSDALANKIPEWFIEDCRVNSLEDIFWRNYKDYSWIKLEVKKRKSIYSTYVYVDLEYIEERINIKFSS